jgi:hypothetical protein
MLVEKPERKRPLGRPRRRWTYNIKVDLKGKGRRVWTVCGSGNGPVASSYEHGNGSLGTIKGG